MLKILILVGELATASSRGHGSVNSFNCDAKLKKKKRQKFKAKGFLYEKSLGSK